MLSEKMANIGLIPARGGSKRVPGKNIKMLGGKPLIAYTIEAARKSSLLDRVIVSTDDEEIAEVALRHGAEVPFLRPKELAGDTTGDYPLIDYMIKELQRSENQKTDKIVYLRPTSPFKTVEIIDQCIQKATDKYSCIRTVTKAEGVYHPYWMFREEEGKLQAFVDGIDLKEYYQRQLLPDCYRLNGVVDIFYAQQVATGDLYGDRIGYVELNDRQSIDIDTEEDFRYCMFLMGENKI